MEINTAQLHSIKPLRPSAPSQAEQVEGAEKLRDAYRNFVGKTFFSQMLKSMQSTVGKAAYFDGGQTEEVFRSQLNDQLADNLSKSTAPQFADPMFEHQFPAQARLLAASAQRKAGETSSLSNLSNLEGLRRW
jgi:Rod binding domain-containing protein